jgi:hypothetical protein
MGRLAGLGFKPKGFRAKAGSKKAILQLKPVYKSSHKGFKLFFKFSQHPKGPRRGSSVQVGACGASIETSSPKVLMEEGYGPESVSEIFSLGSKDACDFSPVVGSVLGLPKLGSEVLHSTVRDGFDPVSSGLVISVSQSSSNMLLAQDPASLELLSSLSFEASLKADGSSLAPKCSIFGSVDFGAIHLGGVTLGYNKDPWCQLISPKQVQLFSGGSY